MRISDWSSDVCSSDLLIDKPMRDLTNLVGVSGDGPGRKGGLHEALQAAVSRWIRCGELNLHRKPVWQPVAKSRRDFRDRDEHPVCAGHGIVGDACSVIKTSADAPALVGYNKNG